MAKRFPQSYQRRTEKRREKEIRKVKPASTANSGKRIPLNIDFIALIGKLQYDRNIGAKLGKQGRKLFKKHTMTTQKVPQIMLKRCYAGEMNMAMR
jgi:hypothetical protein